MNILVIGGCLSVFAAKLGVMLAIAIYAELAAAAKCSRDVHSGEPMSAGSIEPVTPNSPYDDN
jgi:ABC-type nickel/cobalt efflux system permease component RcnA